MVERVRATANSSEMDKVVTELCTNSNGRETQLSVQHFFKVFFDEKDSGAALGGFVVTHIALIVGCAAPLWVYILYGTNGFLPFLGIIALGIGDSAGAIIGSLCGKRRWPRSRRTKEGSLAVFISMFLAVLCLESYSSACALRVPVLRQTMFVFLPLTALEAVTFQIDNLCLPLFAILLSLELSAWSL
uniref:dolichol kinase n=1 Tax=Chaetoceros debilis TaxID=122233 RepID=A0A7S3V9Z6_9STRA